MLISRLKDHLRMCKRASLLELTKSFNVNADVMRDMLGILVRKGQIKKCMKTPACGVKCAQCDVLSVEMYEWQCPT